MQSAQKFLPFIAITLGLFLLVQAVNGIKEYRYIGGSATPSNVIAVSGEGEVFAVADIATFTFTADATESTTEAAQQKVTDITNKAIAKLHDLGVEDKDIKTIDYSAYPKYEYRPITCITTPCPTGQQTLVGYQVSQTISVKVRKVDDAGKILGALPATGVTNLSGLSFTIDDQTALETQARQKAISDAKDKAQQLAKDLGVKLVRIVSFSESGNPMPYPVMMKADSVGYGSSGASTPSVPTGQNKITSNVTITYEIR